ncbi:hypothetical protein VPH35_119490 [Triticum aestivum]
MSPGLSSTDPENPTPRRATGGSPCVWCFICIGLLLVVAGFMLFIINQSAETLYSVSIDSASGLDPPSPTDLTLDHVEFNLTLRIASLYSVWSRMCMEAGTYVKVSYRCVPLAASAATLHALCVGPRKSREEPIVARGVDVRLPGYMMDSLVADIRSGVEAFGVELKRSGGDARVALGTTTMGMMASAAASRNAPSRTHTMCVTSCGARRVGGPVATCDPWADTCPAVILP